jgi:S-adenosylmethionine:tRNA ribosyltransferase-isomerase
MRNVYLRMNPRELRISDFTYNLPDDRIAQHPLENRDASKLLVYRNGEINDFTFRDITGILPEDSLIVFNTTRVVRARLKMRRNTGAEIEIFCTDSADASSGFVELLQQKGKAIILAFAGNAKRWKDEETLTVTKNGITISAKKISPVADQWKVELSWNDQSVSFAEVLDLFGNIPLPPYMKRNEENADQVRYQTVYADREGSVAAPTAGLHFTENVLEELRKRNIRSANVTLHVGAGTFKPVKSEIMRDHDMHREQIFFTRELVLELGAHLNTGITAVGTTAMRTLESIYWFGHQLVVEAGTYRNSVFVGQWEPYENTVDVPVTVALRTVADWMQENNLEEVSGYTQIMIAPGYRFRIANALITNFHQPESTLLLLVAAFTGNDYRNIYNHALSNNYRFLSYGDSSLLFRND